jgi:transcriptional regulator with XRE-family HTH domain
MAKIRLGENLKILLRAHRLSLRELSQNTSIAYSTLYTWMEDRIPSDLVKVHNLAQYFNLKIDELLFADLMQPIPSTPFTFEGQPIEGTYEVKIKKLPTQK